MTPPRRHSQDELDEIAELVRAYVRESQPPRAATNARAELTRRLTDTGSFLLSEVEAGMRSSYERAAVESVKLKLHDEQRRADRAEQRLDSETRALQGAKERLQHAEAALEKRGDRIWAVILLCIGILLAAGAAGIGIGRNMGGSSAGSK